MLDTHYDALLVENVATADVSFPSAISSVFNGELLIVYVVEALNDQVRLARSVDNGVTWGVTVVGSAGSGLSFVSPRIAVHSTKYEIVVVVYEKGGTTGRLRVWREGVGSGEGFIEENEFLLGITVSASDGIQDFVFGSNIYALVFASIDMEHVQIIWTTDFVTYKSEFTLDDFSSAYPTMNYKLHWKEENYLVLVYSYRKNKPHAHLSLYYSQNMQAAVPSWERFLIDSLDTPCTYSLVSCSTEKWYIGYQCSESSGYYTSQNWGSGIKPDDGSVTWVSRSYGCTSMNMPIGGGCFNSVAYELVSNSAGTSYKFNAFDFSTSVSSTSSSSISTNGANSNSFFGFKSGDNQISWVFPDPSTTGKERYNGVTVSMGSNKDLSIFSMIPCIGNDQCDSRSDMCGKSCVTHSGNIKTCETGTVKNCLFQNEANCGATCSTGNCVSMSGIDCIQGDSSNCGRTCQVTGVCASDGTECVNFEICNSAGTCSTEVTTTFLSETTTEAMTQVGSSTIATLATTSHIESTNFVTTTLLAETTTLAETNSIFMTEPSTAEPLMTESTSSSSDGIFTPVTITLIDIKENTFLISSELTHPEETEEPTDGPLISSENIQPGTIILVLILTILPLLALIASLLYFFSRKTDKKKQAEKMEVELQKIQQQSQHSTHRSITEQYFSKSNPSSSE